MLEKLKQLNAPAMDRMLALEEVIALSAFGNGLRSEYENRDIEVPEWLTDGLVMLDKEINRRLEAVRDQEIRQIESQLEGLKTPSERKADLQRRLAKLQKAATVAK